MGFLTFSEGIKMKHWAKIGFPTFSVKGIEKEHWTKMNFVTDSGV